jgi:hypothetical protein
VWKFLPLVSYILMFSVYSILVKRTAKAGAYDYDPCLIIIFAESIKAGLCLALFVWEAGEAAFESLVFSFMHHDWRMAGPALLLGIGNNLGNFFRLFPLSAGSEAGRASGGSANLAAVIKLPVCCGAPSRPRPYGGEEGLRDNLQARCRVCCQRSCGRVIRRPE